MTDVLNTTNQFMNKSLKKLAELDLSQFDTEDLEIYDHPEYYFYSIKDNSIVISGTKQNINFEDKINIENGSNEMEWSINECDVNIFQLKNKEPLLCLYNGIKIVDRWKNDLKKYFPDLKFVFLLNYQDDDDAEIATFRFEVIRENQSSIILSLLDSIDNSKSDEKIGLLIDLV